MESSFYYGAVMYSVPMAMLYTVAVLGLSSEEQLLIHLKSSYESACAGEADVYLTAQSIVNTTHVYFKHSLNPQVPPPN